MVAFCFFVFFFFFCFGLLSWFCCFGVLLVGWLVGWLLLFCSVVIVLLLFLPVHPNKKTKNKPCFPSVFGPFFLAVSLALLPFLSFFPFFPFFAFFPVLSFFPLLSFFPPFFLFCLFGFLVFGLCYLLLHLLSLFLCLGILFLKLSFFPFFPFFPLFLPFFLSFFLSCFLGLLVFLVCF